MAHYDNPKKEIYRKKFTLPGTLPLNLQRNNLVKPYGKHINSALLNAVSRDILAFLLVNMPCSWESSWKSISDSILGQSQSFNFVHPAIDRDFRARRYDWLMWNTQGFMISEEGMIQWLNPKVITFMSSFDLRSSKGTPFSSGQDGSFHLNILHDCIEDEDQVWHWIDSLLISAKKFNHPSRDRIKDMYWRNFSLFDRFNVEERAILINHNLINTNSDRIFQKLHCEKILKNTSLLSTDSNAKAWFEGGYLQSLSKKSKEFLIGFWKINPSEVAPIPLSPLAQTWKDIIRQPLIPFDLETRKRELAHAYEELAPEIACWEKGGTYAAARRLEEEQRQNNT